MMYEPDNWIIIELPTNIGYKVLGGWSGGYLDGDYWRINSGIKSYSEDKEYWYFHGYSGSVYKCNKKAETIRMNFAGVLSKLLENGCKQVEFLNIKERLEECQTLES